MSDSTIKTACEQRRFNLLYNVPLVRNEKTSPYPSYSSAQLNMRRKVEVLKHNKNSNQDRSLSAKEKQALILKGNYRGNVLFCADDHKIAVKTSSSDVPGPIITLQEDKSIPLYNYKTNTFASAISTSEENTEFLFIVLPNVSCSSGLNNTTNISSILIKDTTKTNFSIVTPILFKLEGVNIPIDASNSEISINVNNIDSKVFYGSSVISNDTSTPTIENADFKVKLSTSATTPFNFSAQRYVGYLTISNITLNPSPGFSYNIGISYNVSTTLTLSENVPSTLSQSDVLNNLTFSIVSNLNSEYTSIDEETNSVIEIPNTPSIKSKITTVNGS